MLKRKACVRVNNGCASTAEIKLTASPGREDMALLDQAADLFGAARRILVSQVARSSGNDKRAACNLAGFIERVKQWPK